MFGRKNNKLEQWFDNLPDPLKKDLHESEPSKWNQLLLGWLSSNIKQVSDDKSTQTDKKTDPDFARAADLAKKYGVISEEVIAQTLQIPEDRAEKIVEDLEKAGLVSPKNSDGIRKAYETQQQLTIDETLLQDVLDHLLTEGSVSEELLIRKFKTDQNSAILIIQALEKSGLIRTPQKENNSQ